MASLGSGCEPRHGLDPPWPPPWRERSGAEALGTTKEVLGSIDVLAFSLDFLGFSYSLIRLS